MSVYSAKVREVIEVSTVRGKGKESNDPVRTVVQYWSREGELLAERDEWLEEKQRMKEALTLNQVQ